MRTIKLHIREYDSLGENPVLTSRNVPVHEIPATGQYILIRHKGFNRICFVSNSYMPIGMQEDVEAHVFATLTSAPYQEAIEMGLSGSDLGQPSLEGFEGETIGDLMAFLSQFPFNERIEFQDKGILVAQSKSDYVVLRLDDPSEYKD